MRNSEKTRREVVNNSRDVGDHVSNDRSHIAAVITLQARLLKDYANGRLSTHFHFGLRFGVVPWHGQSEPEWFCAEFQGTPLWVIRDRKGSRFLVHGDRAGRPIGQAC